MDKASHSLRGNEEEKSTESADRIRSKLRFSSKSLDPDLLRVELDPDPLYYYLARQLEKPSDAIAFLLQDMRMTISALKQEHWGREPLHIAAQGQLSGLSDLFTLHHVERLISLSEAHPEGLTNYEDFIFWKVLPGTDAPIVDPEEEIGSRLTVPHLRQKIRGGYFFRFHQPQRFSASLWLFLEKLEGFFQFPISCFITFCPLGSGSLKDCETEHRFIVQLSGRTQWTVTYPNPNPAQCIRFVGPGDILYIPRRAAADFDTVIHGSFLEFCIHEEHDSPASVERTIFFIHNRLPPCPGPKKDAVQLPISLNSKVTLRYGDHIQFHIDEERRYQLNHDIMDEGVPRRHSDEHELVVITSLFNDRAGHRMANENHVPYLRLGVEYEPILRKLKATTLPLTLATLALESEKTIPIDVVSLAEAFNAIGALSISD